VRGKSSGVEYWNWNRESVNKKCKYDVHYYQPTSIVCNGGVKCKHTYFDCLIVWKRLKIEFNLFASAWEINSLF
jgi:hypothetical protein